VYSIALDSANLRETRTRGLQELAYDQERGEAAYYEFIQGQQLRNADSRSQLSRLLSSAHTFSDGASTFHPGFVKGQPLRFNSGDELRADSSSFSSAYHLAKRQK